MHDPREQIHVVNKAVKWYNIVTLTKQNISTESRYSAGLRAGRTGFDSRRELGIFHLSTASRTALGPTHLPIQWVPGALSLGVKRPGREADHSPPSSAEVKE
jgi:hypothetical protein